MRTAVRVHSPPGIISASFAAGASATDSIDLGGGGAIFSRITVPTGWEPANLSFLVSNDGVTFFNFYRYDGTEITVAASAGRQVALDLNDWINVRYIKIRSGSGAGAITQSASQNLTCVIG